MAGEGFELSSSVDVHNGTATAEVLLDLTHFNYPWVLLAIFLVAFVTNSVLTAEPSSDSIEPVVTGPGGKPLPRSAKKSKEEREKRKLEDFSPGRKLVFIWLSAGVITTLVANAFNIVVHALTNRENGWWCGEATAVSNNGIRTVSLMPTNIFHCRYTFALRRSSTVSSSSPWLTPHRRQI